MLPPIHGIGGIVVAVVEVLENTQACVRPGLRWNRGGRCVLGIAIFVAELPRGLFLRFFEAPVLNHPQP